ncbi:MAG TPA: hypothetical protein HPQ03_10730 [Deltaproteobacteria bacterium]|nr:hypothetical protein [Deltaproteobacteria bacterium]
MTHNNNGPNPHPLAHGSNLLFVLSILLISLVLGGGIVWVYCDYRYENVIYRLKKETLKSQACESKIDLHRNVETALQDIVAISGEFQKEFGTYFKGRSLDMGDKLILLQEELVRARQQYRVYEEKLAKIENRDLRHIALSFEFATAK